MTLATIQLEASWRALKPYEISVFAFSKSLRYWSWMPVTTRFTNLPGYPIVSNKGKLVTTVRTDIPKVIVRRTPNARSTNRK
jgi:hypothetical protein